MRIITAAAIVMALGLAQVPDTWREAIALGRTHDEVLLASFSRGYDLGAKPPVTRVELITEFRRAVMIVRAHAEQGEYAFGTFELTPAMAPWLGKVTIVADILLNPLNTYAAPPTYDLYVASGPASSPIASARVIRSPIYPPGVIGGPRVPIAGEHLEGVFPRDAIAAASAPSVVITDEHADVVWQVRLDLSRYR